MAYLKHQYCSVTPGIFKVNADEKEIVIHAKQKQVRKWFENAEQKKLAQQENKNLQINNA